MIVCEKVHYFFIGQAELQNALVFYHMEERCETWKEVLRRGSLNCFWSQTR